MLALCFGVIDYMVRFPFNMFRNFSSLRSVIDTCGFFIALDSCTSRLILIGLGSCTIVLHSYCRGQNCFRFFLKRIYFTVEASAKVVWLISISELILN